MPPFSTTRHGAVDCKKAKLLTDFFESQAASIREQKAKREAKAAGGGAPAAAADGGAGSKRAREEPPERGCVLAFEGVGGEATRDQISALCARCAGGEDAVAFVEFYPGNSAGFARFRTAAAAGAALGALGEGKEEATAGGTGPSALPEDGAPAASRDHPKARAAHAHPGAPPPQRGGSRWPPQPASGRPKDEDLPRLPACRRWAAPRRAGGCWARRRRPRTARRPRSTSRAARAARARARGARARARARAREASGTDMRF